MKASELRIGNWIGRRDSKGNYSEFTVYEETFCDIDRMNLSPIPIPLTEEWLLKFGFKREPGRNSFVKPIGESSDLWHFNDKMYIAGSIAVNVDHCTEVKCEYVHTLQNLYFALTGNELTLKES
jgi:hypothetical protein